MELFRQTNIDFLKYKWWAIGASWALIAVGVFTIFVQKGLKFGIDFSGGTAIALRFAERPDIDQHAPRPGRRPASARSASSATRRPRRTQVLIRVQQQATEGRDVAGEVLERAPAGAAGRDRPEQDRHQHRRPGDARRPPRGGRSGPGGRQARRQPADYYTQAARDGSSPAARSSASSARPRTSTRSPASRTPSRRGSRPTPWPGRSSCSRPRTSGRRSAPTSRRRPSWPIIWSTIGMLAYIAFRFRSLPFGVGAIVALVHDTLITVGPPRAARAASSTSSSSPRS